MVYIIPNCDCKTCNGGTPAPKGQFGGSICNCPCHLSGYPVDTPEHHKWMMSEHRKYMKETLRALAVAEGGQKAGKKFDEEYDDSALFDMPAQEIIKDFKNEENNQS